MYLEKERIKIIVIKVHGTTDFVFTNKNISKSPITTGDIKKIIMINKNNKNVINKYIIY